MRSQLGPKVLGKQRYNREWTRAYWKKLRDNDPDEYVRKKRTIMLKTKYKMTLEDFDALLEKQNCVCAICAEGCKTQATLSVDHCHESGKIRGLLCMRCNIALGKMRDSPALLRKAASYLEEIEHGG